MRSWFKNVRRKVGVGAVLAGAAGAASAQTTGALSGLANLATGLDTADVVAGIIAFGAIIVAVNFARFGTRKAATMVK